MSVAFMRAVVDGLRFNGVPVSFEPGWETRGNGQSSDWEGCITHHTGAGYGDGLWILIHGRSDLRGPLCNVCTYPDGRIHVIAAHPANHAGASGGSWARPFPDTRNFNHMVLGNEVMYPGFQPWTPEQYRSARVFAGVVCGILRRPNPEWARGHYETSITGKWDPGIGNGRAEWFPMDKFRREIQSALKEEVVAVTQDEMNRIAKTVWNWTMSGEPPYLFIDKGWVMQRETRDGIRKLLETQGVDPAVIAQQVAELAAPALVEEVADAVTDLSDEELQRIATAVADEHARRAAA